MTTSLIEAFEMVAQALQLAPRIEAAAAELAHAGGLAEEKTWIDAARRRLTTASESIPSDLLTRALRLPEIEPIKGDHARGVQGAVVDALEHLHAAITFAGGPRAPLLEALYYKLKIVPLRRVGPEEFEAFWGDFEKRLASTYAKRMLADETYAPVGPALELLRKAFATWRGIFIAEPAEGDEADALRGELEAAARRVDLAGRQAKLLAQAALAPLKDATDAAALLGLKKRRGREDEDTHPLLEHDPPDPRDPTPDERDELEELESQRG